MKITTEKILSNVVTINLNMLSAVMKNIIMGNLNGATVVTIKINGRRMRYLQISKRLTKPKYFRSSISKCRIFSFSAGASC